MAHKKGHSVLNFAPLLWDLAMVTCSQHAALLSYPQEGDVELSDIIKETMK